MSLYLLRHGQTILNLQSKFNGSCDEDLSETGIAQAKDAGKKLRELNIDLIFCSPLKRTKQTLKYLDLNPNIKVIYDDRLVERKEGSLAGRDIDREFLENVYLNINSEKIEGLESFQEVSSRTSSLLNEIKEKYKGKNILIISHSFAGRTIYFYFNPLPKDGKLSSVPESYLKNCEIRKFEFKN